MADGLSNSDVALLSRDDGFVTEGDLAASQNSQTQQLQLNNLTEQVADNKFAVAWLMLTLKSLHSRLNSATHSRASTFLVSLVDLLLGHLRVHRHLLEPKM